MPKSLIRGNKGGKGGKRQGPTTSQDVGSGEDRTIYKDEGSTEEEDNNKESDKAKVKNADSVKTGSSDFFMSYPDDDYKGCIESAIECKACIGRDGLSLIHHTCFLYS